MAKPTITKTWLAGLAVMIPGTILIPASITALAAHLETVSPVNWSNLVPDGYSQTMWVLIVLGVIFAAIGIAIQTVAWIGAVLNTRRLAGRRWFNALLWVEIAWVVTAAMCGLALPGGGNALIVTVSIFGFASLASGSVMIAYLVGGPDSRALQAQAKAALPMLLAKPTIKTWVIWGIAAMAGGTAFALLVSFATDPGRLLQGRLWPSLALLSLGFTIMACGVVAATVGWWAAIFNTYRLADRTWFRLLLSSGIVAAVFSAFFGVGALVGLSVLIAYLIAGPDGTAAAPSQRTPPVVPPTKLASTGLSN